MFDVYVLHFSPNTILLPAGIHLLVCMYKLSGNSVGPDQLASQKQADLNLHCVQSAVYCKFGNFRESFRSVVKTKPSRMAIPLCRLLMKLNFALVAYF